MITQQSTLAQFLDDLASKAPTPGGGSAAAIMGAMGAALVSMVSNLTVGKDQYAAVEPEMRHLLARADALRGDLLAAVAADIRVFDEVMAAYALPRTPEAVIPARTAAIQTALRAATEVPLGCARLCAEVIALSRRAAANGNTNVISDAGVAVMAAYAGLKSAALNVYINIKALKDRDFAARCKAETDALCLSAERDSAEIYALVMRKL